VFCPFYPPDIGKIGKKQFGFILRKKNVVSVYLAKLNKIIHAVAIKAPVSDFFYLLLKNQISHCYSQFYQMHKYKRVFALSMKRQTDNKF